MELGYGVNSITQTELDRREEIMLKTRYMVSKFFPVRREDDYYISTPYNGDFYLQIAFSRIHPLMVLYLAKPLNKDISKMERGKVFDLNTEAVLGTHFLDVKGNYYVFRSTHWLDVPFTSERFKEILDRVWQEASHGYSAVTRRSIA